MLGDAAEGRARSRHSHQGQPARRGGGCSPAVTGAVPPRRRTSPASWWGASRLNRHALRAFALSDNPAVVTALSNDYDFDEAYARQLMGIGRSGDVLFALSTSGTSPNVVNACRVARDLHMHVVGHSGEGGGEMRELCDTLIAVPSRDTHPPSRKCTSW